MHSDIVTFQHNNQPVTTSQELSRLTGIPHSKILRSIRTMERYYKELDKLPAFNRDFIVMTEKIIKANIGENSNVAKRGRPSIVYLLNKEGSLSFIGSLTGKKACEFRIAIADAFVRMEQTIATVIPELQAENEQLRLENEQLRNSSPKQIAGPRKGMLPVPVIEYNLWNEQEIVAWEMQPMDQVDELLITMAKLRHCNHIAQGLEQKKKILTDKLVQEELGRRSEITDLTQKRFDVKRRSRKTKD